MREGAKTLILSLLVVSTLVMAGLVWMKPPQDTREIIKREDRKGKLSEEVRKDFLPRKALINFGPGDHTQVSHVKNIWGFYENILLESFLNEGNAPVNWKEISNQEYYDLHQRPSVVFDLGNNIYSHLFLESFKIRDKNKDLEGRVKEVYFSSNGAFLVLVTENGNYKFDLSDVSSQGMEKYLKNIKADPNQVPYKSLFELYNIDSLVYIPLEPLKEHSEKVYQNDLYQIDPAYENDLAQRFLGQPVELARVIEEDESTLYVVDQKTLRLDRRGLVDFSDRLESNKAEERDLNKSIEEVQNFIVQKTGIGKRVYFDSLAEIEKDGRKGYHFKLNYIEGAYPVFPLLGDKQKAYMEVDVVENKVVHLSYLYRTESQDQVQEPGQERPMLKVDEIMYKNLDRLSLEVGLPGKPLAQVLERVENINICLLDQVKEERTPLEMGYEVDFGHKKIYFRASDGQMVMER